MNIATRKSKIDIQDPVDWRKRAYKIYNSEAFVAFLFLLIPVILLAALKIYPVFYNLYLSFTRYELFEPPRFVGLKNYQYVFTNEVTRQSIGNTILFTLEAVPLGTALALTIAKLLDQKIRGRVFIRTLYYLPVVSSVVVSAMIWRWIYSPQNGLLNHLISGVGIPAQNWLNDPNLALISLVIVTIWGSIGSNMVIFLAGLQDIPSDVLEAARVDGANSFQSFLFITVPLMRPIILFVVVTFTISIFRNFGLIFMLTQGGPFNRTNTMVWEVYQNVFGYLRLGRGAAISVVMLIIVLILTMISFRVLRERQEGV
jgi:multiple sugar transport system permease protein